MQVDSPDKIRNVAVVGHNDTGKTTLTSSLLFAGGVTTRLNTVEDGNAITDFDSEEIERQISIGLGCCFVPWSKTKVNIIDCPGYGIFFTETKSGIRAADTTLLCVNGVAGIEVTTEKAWEFAAEAGSPVAIHLTKMDRERANFDERVRELQEQLGREVAPVQVPIGVEAGFRGVVDLISGKAFEFEKDGDGKAKPIDVPAEIAEQVEEWTTALVELVAENDEALLDRFFDAGELTEDELRQGVRDGLKSRKLFPLTLSASVHGIGPSCLLDSVVELFPSPSDRGTFPATNIGGEEVALDTGADEPLSLLVFKTLNDPFSGKLTLLRVASGTLNSDSQLWNPRTESKQRVSAMLLMQGKQTTPTTSLVSGDIGAIAKLKDVATGDTLCAESRPVQLAWIPVDEPAMSFAIEPKSKGDEEKIGDALNRLVEEDITLRTGRDPQTGEYLLSGAGQLHSEITVAKLKSRSNVEVILHPPKVPYRETIRRPAVGHGRHKKQSGGRGQFADCRIKIEPLERGEDFSFEDKIFGGSIPQQYRPAVEKGIQEVRARGFLAGYPMVDFKVQLVDGQYHDVDSSELAFKIAGSLAYRDAMAAAAPTILEPVMHLEVTTSEEFMGDIMSDLSQRRGRPQGMESKNNSQIVKAMVPMAEMLNYAPSLRSMTQGRSSFHLAFSHYEEVPKQIQQKLIEQANQKVDDG